MKRRSYLVLITAIILTAFIVLINLARNGNRRNGFRRWFLAEITTAEKTYNSPYELFRVIGPDSDKILLQGNTSQHVLILADSGISKQPLFTSGDRWKGARIFYDSPCFTLASGITKGVIKKCPGEDREQSFKVASSIYSRACLISNNKLALRVTDSHNKDQYFLVRSLTDSAQTISKQITKQFHDGGLVTDGSLLYSPDLKKLVYVFYHKGAYLTMDTDLNAVSEHYTIDTFRAFHHYSIQNASLGKLSNERARFESINSHCTIGNGCLYICSSFEADNESNIVSGPHYNIDIYDLKTNRYKGTYVVPRLSDVHLRSIWAQGTALFLIYPYTIYKFHLPAIAVPSAR